MTQRRPRRFSESPTAACLTVNLHLEPIMQIDSSPICVCANSGCGVNCRAFRRGNPRPLDGVPVDIFKEAEIGSIPADWHLVRLGDLCVLNRRTIEPSAAPGFPYVGWEHISTGASFPLLADPDHAAADAYEVFDLLGDGMATPSMFMVDLDGYIVWSYVGQHAADRPGAHTILSHLPGEE